MLRFFLISFAVLIIVGCSSNVSIGDPTKPNHKNQDQLNNDVLNYYDYFKNRYIRESNGETPGGGFYVLAESTGGLPEDWIENNISAKSNSEAIGYGLIVTALVGDKVIFDGLYNMFDKYPSSNNPELMSWVLPENEDQTLSKTGSASDGDMDIAYGLYLAHKKWGSNGDINYLDRSIRVIKACEDSLIGDNSVILMGDWAKDSQDEKYWTATRSSDWFPGHFQLFEHLTGNTNWSKINRTVYNKIIPNVANEDTGLVPDFIKGNFTAPRKRFLETPYDGFYNWNACRYPWRQSIGYGHVSDPSIKTAIKKQMTKIAEFAIDEIGDYKDFYKINPGYQLEGYPIIGRDYTSSAFSTPFITSFTVDPKYQEYLNMGWDYIKKRKESYFADSITMLNMLYISGIWYNPINEEPMEVKKTDAPDIILDQSKLVDVMDRENWIYDIHKDDDEDMAEAVIDFKDEIAVDVRNVGTVPYSVAIYNFPIPFIKRNYYQIDFKVKSTVARDIYVFLGMSKPPWRNYGGEYISLKADGQWQDYRVVLQMDDRTDTEGELGIQFGKMSVGYKSLEGTYYLKDISVKEFEKE